VLLSPRFSLIPLVFSLIAPFGCRNKDTDEGESKEAAALFDEDRVIEVSIELAE
jgi:hypothetical protein